MKFFKNPHSHFRKLRLTSNRSGFALVVSLVLMGMIVSLLAGLSLLVTVESQSAGLAQSHEQARQNALYGLHEAIGQLQRYAGPDQRVTARADILNTANPLWTGVWPSDVTQSLDDVLPVGDPKWLISNSTNTINPASGVTNPIPVQTYTNPSGSTVEIDAGLVSIDTPAGKGGYAWWVDDESLKASLFLKNATKVATDTAADNLKYVETARRFGVFPGSSPQAVSQDDWGNFDYASFDVDSYRPLALGEAPLVNSNGGQLVTVSNLKKYITDFTGSAQGVLSDVVDGGLRKDLTRGLDDQYNSALEGGTVFQERDNDSGQDIFGERWKLLRDYYNSYKTTDSYTFDGKTLTYAGLNDVTGPLSSIYSRTTRRVPYWNSNGFFPYQSAYPNNKDSAPIAYTANVRPVMLRAQMTFGFSTVPDSLDPSKYRLKLHYYPSITLWNPYNVSIDPRRGYNGSGNLTTSDPTATADSPQLWFSIVSWLNIGVNGSTVINTASAEKGASISLELPRDEVLEPGAIKVYALPSGTSSEYNNSHYSIREDLVDSTKSDSLANVWSLMSGNTTFDPGDELKLTSLDGEVQLNAWLLCMVAHESMFIERRPIVSLGGVDDVLLGTAAEMENNPILVAGIDVHAREILGSDSVPMFAQMNPIGFREPRDPAAGGYSSGLFYQGTARGSGSFDLTGSIDILFDPLPDFDIDTGHGYWGNSYLSNGQSRIAIYDLPRHPLVSIGELMHVNSSHWLEVATYPVGSSYPSVSLSSPSETFDFQNRTAGIDLPYYMNRALFDKYFFSTVPGLGRDIATTYPYDEVFDQSYLDLGKPLPNPRLVYRENTNMNDLRGVSSFDTAASDLLIDGVFNINSTSVNAWAAVLAGFRGKTISGTSGSSYNANDFENDDVSPFLRNFVPRGGSNEDYMGYRALTDDQIRDLAQRIVDEIRSRRASSQRPFSSLGDFINRDPTASNGHELMGALQAAIDDIDNDGTLGTHSLNAGGPGATGNRKDINVEVRSYTAGRDFVGSVQVDGSGAGLPGWLSQQDILRPLAPFMSARGDTFRIRVYGEERNPLTNKVTGHAWGEAVVQRLPEYIDESNDAWMALGDAGFSPENQTFGRRFEIVSFRWLNEEDV